MNSQVNLGFDRKRKRLLLWSRALAAFIIFVLAFGPLAPTVSNARFVQQVSATSTINIVVIDATTGDPVPNFKWMINLDNTHENASLVNPTTFSPVVATGEVRDGSGMATGIVLPNTEPPNRGYLVSILANDGVGTLYDPDYKIGGAHFTLPQDAGNVVVELYPNPLPLATVRVRVFHDNRMVNSEDDIPLEDGLAGFHVVLSDRVGEVTTDWFGNPICTQYEDLNGDGQFTFPEDLNADGDPVPVPGTGGFCVSGPDGYAVIPNLGPDKYEVEVVPPDGSGWIQTTTIEGTLAIDAWVEEGHSGFSTEEGFTQAVVWFGFVRECSFGNPLDDCTSPTANMTGRRGQIRGRIRSISLDDESGLLRLGNPVPYPYIALNNIGGDDEQVYTGRGNADGTFTIPNVPRGLYQLVIWDRPLDHIIQFRTVEVRRDNCPSQNLNPCIVNLGDIGIPPWFGKIRGYVYIDNGIAANGTVIPGGDENGLRDCINPNDINTCERGLPAQDLDTRFKDGSIQYTAFSDATGYYEFPEVFELEHFTLAEVGYGRFKNTGAASYETDDFGRPLNYPAGFVNQDLGLAGLLQAAITWAGTTNYIDWGKKAFAPDENGGIVGIVFYATTRNELDARFQAAEDYEAGVPGVTVNLYVPVTDENGEPRYDPTTGEILKDHLANVYITDDWYASRPTNCLPRGSVGRDATQVQPYPQIWEDCIELPSLLNQLRPGVFDGGYAFEEDCSNPNPDGDDDGDGTPNRFDPDTLATTCQPLQPGKWVVEVVPPPGFKVVKEEDINVFSGDQFVPAVPPPPCVGPLHTVNVVDDPNQANFDPNNPSTTSGVYNPDFLAATSPLAPNGGSPYQGQRKPLCNQRLIDLKNGFNANSDFFIFTDVPMPGRIRGVLLDDLVLELDPNSPLYAEKRGIPNAPVGIRDFTGRLITTVYSDENGYWEVLLPSTGTYNCALPAGPCPGVYQVVGNDPGTPVQPNVGWNPNYGTLKLSFDVWPMLTTYADVAILPITGFVQRPGPQFEPAPICEVPADTPDLQRVSQPYGSPGDSITIYGQGFGSLPGSVTLDGEAIPAIWSSTAITATIPTTASPGTHQLLVTAANGQSSQNGITLHVFGAGYTPPVLYVDVNDPSPANDDNGSPTNPYHSIQAALNAASDGTLILVRPGTYFESLLVDERVKLQGYGPGASVIDGRFFNFGGVSAEDFAAVIAATPYDGPAEVPMGQVITVLAENGEFTANFNAQIDGFKISGGSRVRGSRVLPSQGGAVYAHAYARYLEVSNNLIQSNAGNLGGGVILGQPFVTNPDAGNTRNNENDFVRIHHNRILNNGGVSLAGALALFNGAEGFRIDHNVICGNYSAEYGGGISNYGYNSGRIQDNKVLFNFAFDEGGGIMIAGEQPRNILAVSPGTGNIDIERNLIQGNLSNDDGGGVRLLQPVDGRIRIINNMIVNNLATDTGGGIALDDALNVQIINNTIARNVSTATAEDADRSTCSPALNGSCPHGAGLVSEPHSAALMAARNPSTNFSNPVLFNNIFWQNEAFYLDGTIGLFGGGLPSAGYIDLEVLSPATGNFSSFYNLCTAFSANCPNNGTNLAADPQFIQAITTNFDALAFGGDPTFVTVIMRSAPGDPPGDYHLAANSPAVDAGAATQSGANAPCDDYDRDGRPNGTANDIGADEQPGTPVSPTCGVVATMHVGDLDGTAFNLGATGNWRARVTVRVEDASHAPIANATVIGIWSAGDAVGMNNICVTDLAGQCQLNSGRLSRATDANVTFTVTNVTHLSYDYLPGSNHDTEGDSNGTSITVNRPPSLMPFSDAGWIIFLPSITR